MIDHLSCVCSMNGDYKINKKKTHCALEFEEEEEVFNEN